MKLIRLVTEALRNQRPISSDSIRMEHRFFILSRWGLMKSSLKTSKLYYLQVHEVKRLKGFSMTAVDVLMLALQYPTVSDPQAPQTIRASCAARGQE